MALQTKPLGARAAGAPAAQQPGARARRRLLQTALWGAAGAALPLRAAASVDPRAMAAHALNRLGYGPRSGDLAEVARDPRGWAIAQLEPERLGMPEGLMARLSESAITQADPIRQSLRLADGIAEQQAAQARQGQPVAPAGVALPEVPATPAAANPVARLVREVQLPALESRIWRALESPRQLEEVMVDFWFNHFNVFVDKNWNRVMVGHYEHFAIRPYVLGRFSDLLRASAHHPAMLYYLDNWISVGAGMGPRGSGGLNENYARELMELHTLGVDGGYTQSDVTQLARMLTGWSMVPPRRLGGRGVPSVNAVAPGARLESPGFWFNPAVHDGGEKQWLGRQILPGGKAEGDAALELLAVHPATARNLAYKLVQYFVTDSPDPQWVNRLAQIYLAEGGQIRPVLRALFGADAFWAPGHQQAKFKTPWHYTLSVLRALGHSPANVQAVRAVLAAQGMGLWACPSPDGWRNTESAWLNPDAMSKRVNLAAALARGSFAGERMSPAPQAEALLDTLGPLATSATRAQMRETAHDPVLSITLALAGPGMMRR